VTDTGLGIAAEELPLVFQRFHHSAVRGARSREGAGIGLSLVSDLARAHGGDVSVRSELGAGSVFTVRVPRAQVGTGCAGTGRTRAGPAGAARPAHQGGCRRRRGRAGLRRRGPNLVGSGAGRRAGRTVAGIGIGIGTGVGHRWSRRAAAGSGYATSWPGAAGRGHIDLRSCLGRLLTADGWEVEAVGSVDEALATRAVPDLVLTDVMLPGRTGIELILLMRADPALARIPATLLTARAGADSAADGLRAGADDYIVKPFAPAELLARLRTHYELTQLREYALGREEDKAANLELALASNRQIGAAMGILMSQLRLTDEQAFDLLRKASQRAGTASCATSPRRSP
jgi:DNA-binding response OmpR family regulator